MASTRARSPSSKRVISGISRVEPLPGGEPIADHVHGDRQRDGIRRIAREAEEYAVDENDADLRGIVLAVQNGKEHGAREDRGRMPELRLGELPIDEAAEDELL